MVRSLALFGSCVLLTTVSLLGCSNSDDSSPDPSSAAGGAGAAGAAGANTAGAAGAGAAGANTAGAAGGGGQPAMGACTVAASGAVSYPTMTVPCGLDYAQMDSSAKDYQVNFALVFKSPSGEDVSLGCTLKSPSAPAAGDTWAITPEAHHIGDCSYSGGQGAAAKAWEAKVLGDAVQGSGQVVFSSAAVTPAKNHPTTTYYSFELDLTTTMKSVAGGDPDVTITAHISQPGVPFGF
jgi:hypothetical protein